MIKEELLYPGGPCLFYDTALFPPGTDSFALGWFARAKSGEAVCDLGSGSGLLGTLLLARTPYLRHTNVELSPEASALAEKAFARNGWSGRVRFSVGDLRDAANLPPAGSVDLCVANPPYFKAGSGESSPLSSRRTAREEGSCTLADICTAAGRILRWGGRFSLVYRPERLPDLLCTLREHGLEAKRIRLLQSRPDAAPSLVLLEARRGGKPGLTWEAPFLIGSPEWEKVYFR